MKAIAIMAMAVGLFGAANAQPSGPAKSDPLRGPTHFLDGRKANPALLSAIQDGMTRKVDFAGHLSSAITSCGTECASYWFVDRQTGGVIAVPESPLKSEFIQDVETTPESDVAVVTYEPMTTEKHKCAVQPWRWDGKSWVKAGNRSKARCPQ
jgi:hypothetical protein